MYQFAIIGCGRIAARHAENIVKVGKLVAVCDNIPEKADAFANQFNCKAYYSIDDLLTNEKEIDIVSVCSPNGLHAEHAIKSLQAGKNVLCEKPMCITSVAGWQMIDTAYFCRKKLFVVKSTHFNPLIQSLKNILNKKLLGHVYSFQLSCFWNRPAAYYTDWYGKKFPDGGTFYTQFSHYIDALIWMLGDINQVKGFADNKAHQQIMEFEDTGAVALKLENNLLGTFNWFVNTFQKNYEISLTIIAEKGTICLSGAYMNEIKYQYSENDIRLLKPISLYNEYGLYNGSLRNHKEVYEQLIKALSDNEQSFTNAFDELKTVEAIEQIYKAVNQV